MNLAELPEKEIQQFGEHVSVIYQDRRWTNTEMHTAAKRLAAALRSLGVEKGDRVIIQMPNCPEVLQSFLAVYMLGAVVVPVNFMIGEAETAFIYQDAGAKVVISNSDFLAKIEACRKNAPKMEHVILTDQQGAEDSLSYHHLLEAHSAEIAVAPTRDDDLAALIYTAGTTGRPKGVMHTHSSLYANARMQHETINLPPGLTSVSVLPLCHAYGIASMNYAMVAGGGKSIILNTFDIDTLFAAIETYKAHILGAVPTMYVFMLLYPDPQKYDLSSMKYWICGSAPLSRETWMQFKEIYGYEIVEGWGLTEAGANNAVNPLDGKKKVGSIGLPMKGTRMQIVNTKDRELPANKEGELILSGPMLMKGYWRRPEETEKVLRNGWLYTGDIGYRDEEGYFFVTERKNDLIIKGGENIAPREVEEVLYSHPKVSEAAVVGMPDAVYGEDIKAFVVLLPGEQAEAQEILHYCRERLKKFKSPKEVVFMESLPKSLMGKILRKELRGM